MGKWARVQYVQGTPLGKDGKRVTASEEHRNLSKCAAMEGMVLLKNDKNVLPLAAGAKIALFGKGTFDYVKGGGGSGDVTVDYIRNLYDGFKLLGDRFSICEPVADFYREDVKAQYAAGREPGMTVEPKLSDELIEKAKAFTDTAIISISRFSGEGWDRKSSFDGEGKEVECGDLGPSTNGADIFEKGDFYLSVAEQEMVDKVTANFANVIVVLNIGGMMDTSWFKVNENIQSVLLAWQGGMEGGLAAAELLAGLGNPSGKLVDTFANTLEDYPSSATFHESDSYVDYTEDIYVGYRYFETIPGAAAKVSYPFGYGLSYTKFAVSDTKVEKDDLGFVASATVCNVGDKAGKEVIQVYVEAPQGKLGKSARSLVAFGKTDLLAPGECRTISLHFTEYQMASYDDTGKVCKSSYLLEKGDYKFHIGTSIRDTVCVSYAYRLEEDKIIETLSQKMTPSQLSKRMKADGTFEALEMGETYDTDGNLLPKASPEEVAEYTPSIEPQKGYLQWGPYKKDVKKLEEVAQGTCTMEEFLAQLTDRQLIHMLGGQPNTGVADTFGYGNIPEYGIPSIMTADGPAGLRIRPDRGVSTTAWPCATLLACSWNPDMVEQVGAAGGAEIKENCIGFWLTPAVNIHRSPLCGRNFEYYSEDPFVAGQMGSAMTKGIQSNRVGVSVKHFALNNKETNRRNSDSRASERAIREIYLKPFEMIVKQANPWTIMSSYNIINGHRASENKELLTDILREEWGFEGFVTTDWWTYGEHYKELLAGNDIKMGCGFPDRLEAALKIGAITREDLERSVKRLFHIMFKID